jgi:hypothetical protein
MPVAPFAAVRSRVLAAGTALALAAVAMDAAAAAAPAPCRVVVGGGTRIARTAAADADFWNRLNFSFYDAGQYVLSTSGRDAIGLFFLVGTPESARGEQEALVKAAAAGCDEVVRLSVDGDDGADGADALSLVFRVAVAPIEPAAASDARGPAPAPALRLGAPTYQREYRYAVTPDVEREVKPSVVGERAVQAFLDATAR